MSYSLYVQSIADYRRNLTQNSALRARELSKEVVVEGDIDKLVNQLCPVPPLHIAKLCEDQKRGVREGKTIRVHVPFQGDLKTFQIKSSICTQPAVNIELRSEEIIIVLEDNDVLENKLEACLGMLKKNSEVLRSEWANLNDEAKMVCRQIVQSRRSQIVAERERDAKRSFPIN